MNPSIWMILVLAFARLFGFMYFFPLISGDQVPPMVRALMCIGLTPFVATPQFLRGALDPGTMQIGRAHV